ncbi:deoxyribodipyrimidine photo-lyase [Sphingomonas sp. LaA6.9]|uniref:cryptochrome/photolyase family protein n=1 Tax=Sphingomonas sp. LaA6.9 TaxID=2919914 RepID=UPI001F501A57|nr:deoxyribodipyrimidine photo-lyase [Sphingomonas sp. LaA6.9]MCJ8155858.1 DNA photolyase family protein [Sphingomonas sp. LaA6.9]
MTDLVLVWLRQDLRLSDQAAFAAAAAEGAVVAVYVLDDAICGQWAMGGAQRWWLHHSLAALAADLSRMGVQLVLRRGDSAGELISVARALGVRRVHALHHYEPWWKDAEAAVAGALDLCLHDGTRLMPPERILTGGGGRYRMFTPFWRALLQHMPPPLPARAPEAVRGHGAHIASDALDAWELQPRDPDWAAGFSVWNPGEAGARAALRDFLDHVENYETARNLPSEPATSRLSPHLHFGEISPAKLWHHCARRCGARAEPFLREVAWRDFAANVIDILPDYGRRNGRPAFDAMPWREGAEADADFHAWTRGRTGYPIVDAGMRELWATGWMHNRVRMIAASFLVKHLLIDWRRGERWFWDTLVDADYGNNAVNWQWIAGTGIDANMFGRIMAPLSQSGKFDAGRYIRRWVPELGALDDDAIHDPEAAGLLAPPSYPAKIVGHREGRERALAAGNLVRA